MIHTFKRGYAMKYAVLFIGFIFVPGILYGMGDDLGLGDLEAGTRPSASSSFVQADLVRHVSQLEKMGLIANDEHDVMLQIQGLSEAQKGRLLAAQTTRCGSSGGGGFFASWFGSAHQADGEAVHLLRDLHRIALEEQRNSQVRVEEVEKLSRRFKILLFVVGTGLLGSLGTNGGLLANILSGGAEVASGT